MTLAALTIPAAVWPFIAVAALCLLSWWETRQINRRRDENWLAIEAERKAREASQPVGNVDRVSLP